MDKIYTKFKEWLDSIGISPLAFSRMIGINHTSIYKAYHGSPLTKKVNGRKIVKISKGEVTLSDLGIQ